MNNTVGLEQSIIKKVIIKSEILDDLREAFVGLKQVEQGMAVARLV